MLAHQFDARSCCPTADARCRRVVLSKSLFLVWPIFYMTNLMLIWPRGSVQVNKGFHPHQRTRDAWFVVWALEFYCRRRES
jgi:hypothetical protein